ncbi:MAG: hypothetical protein A4E72_01567 [Syntrophus sp. PtaU1.Bin208]|nr:MAG: hypothetical protein A4E72_01567 [Syntrophus sp. PtaU1.Bin208]
MIPCSRHIGRDILSNRRCPPDDAVCPDPRELVDSNHTADDGKIIDMNMTGQMGSIGDDDVISQLAVMGDMAVSHDEVVIPDHGNADICRRGPIHGHILTKYVMTPDDNPCFFPFVLQILRIAAQGTEGGNPAFLADIRIAFNNNMGSENRIFLDDDTRTDDTVCSNFNTFRQAGIGRYNCCGMNPHG